jgi:hypothetical protein
MSDEVSFQLFSYASRRVRGEGVMMSKVKGLITLSLCRYDLQPAIRIHSLRSSLVVNEGCW